MTNHLQTYSCAKRVDSLHQWIVTMPLLADDVTCRIRSKGTDVACMHKSFFATFDRYVKHVSFFLPPRLQFLFKKRRAFTFSGFNEFLIFDAVKPAVERRCSLLSCRTSRNTRKTLVICVK